MRKKKPSFRAGLLSALLALSLLAGCGGGNPVTDVSKSAPDADAPEVTDAPAEPETPPPAPRPVLGVTTEMEYHYDDNLALLVNSMEARLPGVDSATREEYPALADALDSLRESTLDTERMSYEDREAALEELRAEGNYSAQLSGDLRAMVRRADAQAVSIVNAWRDYSGGVHGSYGYASANFDTATGAPITLESLLTDAGAAALNERIGQELNAVYPDLSPGANVAEYAPEDYNFSVEPDGVTFWFNPYEIAAYASGLLTVKLYFDRDADILNDTYKGTDEAWFVEIGNEVPYRFQSAGGTVRTVEAWEMVNLEYPDWLDGFGLEFDTPDESDRWTERPTVIDGENGWTIPEGRNIIVNDTGHYDFHAYYAHIPAGDFVVILISMENDAQEIFVYRADGRSVQTMELTGPGDFFYPELPEDVEEIDDWENYDNYRLALTDPYSTDLSTRVYMFSTWTAGGNYKLTGTGFQLRDELLYGGGFALTLKQDLTVTRCEPDAWTVPTDREITIPAGREVDIVAVNPALTTVYFRVPAAVELTNDDKEFIFALSYDNGDNDELPRTVHGVEEEELFEGLMYAG